MRQSDSNDVKVGIFILINLRFDRWINAMPPPLPTGRGLCRSVKLGGVREFSVDGRASGVSQVSVRVSMSISWSKIKSWRRAGLLIVGEIDAAEHMLRFAN